MDQTYEDYGYEADGHSDHYGSMADGGHGYENGNMYGADPHQHYDGSYGSLGDVAQLESDEDMW